ncbi:hypothetical protein [Serratia marcescens]|uniref:hypothetical protein n=1 Tax=Serratia marcescens TaxID=615 RepID=UPI001BB0758B|nr:hypothetical protein [Serratia marcescens]MBS3895008.1 hypothetical protein [Serratia marcescens]
MSKSKVLTNAAIAFLFICVLGAFIGLAGGVAWWTYGCGVLTTFTLLIACMSGLAAFATSANGW